MEKYSLFIGRCGVSLPFTDDCELILNDHVDAQEAFETICQYGKASRWNKLIISTSKEFLLKEPHLCKFYTHTLNLRKSEKQIFKGFRKNARNNIKKAIREEVQVENCNSIDAMNEFYRLYAITRRRLGRAVPSVQFFKNIYNFAISKGKGILLHALHENKVIAAGVFFHFNQNAIFRIAVYDKNYQHLRPNNLIAWEAIKFYAKRGFKSFSFGVTPFDNDGLRRYKSCMAESENIMHCYAYDFKRRSFITGGPPKSHIKVKIVQRLPISILKLYGKLSYRHTAI